VVVAAAAAAVLILAGRHSHAVGVRRLPPPTTGPAATVPSRISRSTNGTQAVTLPLTTTSLLPGQTGTRLVDLTWISNSRGWALVSVPCPAGTCAMILFTSDGGQTWAHAPRVPDVSSAASQGCLLAGCFEHLRYASSTIGYLWGQALGLFMTVDGGQNWVQQPASQMVALEPVPGSVVRVAAPTGLASPLEVDRAPLGSGRWTSISTDVGNFGGVIFTAGRSIYIAWPGHTAGGAPDAHTRFVRSLDGGTTWRSFGDPCGQSNDGTELDASVYAATPNGVLAVLCVPRFATTALWLTLSSDSGDHFGALQPVPVNAAAAAQLALADDGRIALVASAGGGSAPTQVIRSNDGGRTWAGVLSAPPATTQGVVPWFGFEDAATGRVSFGTPALWTTTDAGLTWSEEQVSSSM
jgi:photosystem II stability/assembly factor-like uncharacterized protein